MARKRESFISENEKDELVEKTKAYFEKERDEDIGNIESLQMIDFFMKELGPIISSKVIRSFKERVEMRLEDAEIDEIANLHFGS